MKTQFSELNGDIYVIAFVNQEMKRISYIAATCYKGEKTIVPIHNIAKIKPPKKSARIFRAFFRDAIGIFVI